MTDTMTMTTTADTMTATDTRKLALELAVALRLKGHGKLADCLCNANTAARPALCEQATQWLMQPVQPAAPARPIKPPRTIAPMPTANVCVAIDVVCQGRTSHEVYDLDRALQILATTPVGIYMTAVHRALRKHPDIAQALQHRIDVREQATAQLAKLRTLAALSNPRIDSGWSQRAARACAALAQALQGGAHRPLAMALDLALEVMAQTASGIAKRTYALVNRQLASQQAGGVIVTQREAQRAMARVKRAMSRRYGKRVALSATLHSTPPTSALPVTCRLQPAMTSHVVRWQPTRPEHLFLIPATRAERYRARAMAMGPKAIYEAVALAQYAGIKRAPAPTYELIADPMAQAMRHVRPTRNLVNDKATLAMWQQAHDAAAKLAKACNGGAYDRRYYIGLNPQPLSIAPMLATCGCNRAALLTNGHGLHVCMSCAPYMA